MKVGKEETLGILAAVEWSLSQDEAAMLAGYEAVGPALARRAAGNRRRLGGARLPERSRPAARPRDRPLRPAAARSHATRWSDALWAQKPRIAVSKVGDDAIALNPQTLEPGEDLIVLNALRGVLTRVPVPAVAPGSPTALTRPRTLWGRFRSVRRLTHSPVAVRSRFRIWAG